jgi:predicted ATPase
LPTRTVPATLQDLVMARLDRLGGDREVAQLAATLGREFEHDLLAAVAPLDEAALRVELANLVGAEVLYVKGRPPRCTYLFKHALLQDALANALVKGKRQQFHRRIAEVLEARFPQTREGRRSCSLTTSPRRACPRRRSATGCGQGRDRGNDLPTWRPSAISERAWS